MSANVSYAACFSATEDEFTRDVLVFLDEYMKEAPTSAFRAQFTHEAVVAHIALSLAIIKRRPTSQTDMLFRDPFGSRQYSNCHMYTTCALLIMRAQSLVLGLHQCPGVRALPRAEYKTDKTSSPNQLLTDVLVHLCLMDFARLYLVAEAPVMADTMPNHPIVGRDALFYNQLLLMCTFEAAYLTIELRELCGQADDSTRLARDHAKLKKRVDGAARLCGLLHYLAAEAKDLPCLNEIRTLAARRYDEALALVAFAEANTSLARSLLHKSGNGTTETLAVDALALAIGTNGATVAVARAVFPVFTGLVFDGPLPTFAFCRPEYLLRDLECRGAVLPAEYFPVLKLA